MTKDEALQKIKLAMAKVQALCSGEERWTMSIPVQPNYDHDIVIADALKAAEKALGQPEQEPVAWANRNDLQNFDMKVRANGGPLHTVPLYTSPKAKPWVGLTDVEIMDCWPFETRIEFARWIEAKLKERNT